MQLPDLPQAVFLMWGSGIPLHVAAGKMEDAVRFSVVPDEDVSVVFTYLQLVLNKNPGFATLITSLAYFNGEIIVPPENIIASTIPLYVAFTSFKVE